MSVAEAFMAPPVRSYPCKVCTILGELEPEARRLVAVALAAEKEVWPHAIIAQRLTKQGHAVSSNVVASHRQKCA